jgi:hypothetical protein
MEGQRHCLFLYLKCLAVAHDHGGSRKAISGWLIIESQLRKVAQTDQEWSRNARKLWSDFILNESPIHVAHSW